MADELVGMVVLSAKDVRNIEDSFYDVLEHAPGSKENKQSFFRKRHNIQITKQNYGMMWDRLKESLGRAKAGEAIFDYVLNTTSDRLKHVLTLAMEDEHVDILSRDPLLLFDLFWENGNPRRICEHLVAYMHETDFKWPELETKGGSVLPENSGGQYEYDIALSFAGEQHSFVEFVANALRSNGVKVFYDDFEEGELWGEELRGRVGGWLGRVGL